MKGGQLVSSDGVGVSVIEGAVCVADGCCVGGV